MARMTMRTTAPLNSGSGSLNGTADQVSLPSMSASSLLPWRRLGDVRARLFGTRYGSVDDAFEEVRLDRAIGHRRHGFAWLCQLRVTGIVECRPAAANLFDPG